MGGGERCGRSHRSRCRRILRITSGCSIQVDLHFAATVLDQVGVRMKVAQELLRHADIQTTMNIYTSAMEQDKQKAADLVARRLLKKAPAAFSEPEGSVH